MALVNQHLDSRGICTLTLNRPQCHNALNAQLISELATALAALADDPKARLVILTGEGDSFCSGADLQWMKDSVDYSQQENQQDALQLATLLRTLYELNKPTIARIDGPAFGGALGLITACDIAVASNNSRFAFSEIRLGLIPAMISPYIIEAIGLRQARRLFLSAERFDAHQAEALGLIHTVTEKAQLDKGIEQHVQALLQAGPNAIGQCKQLLRTFSQINRDQSLAELIATIRSGDEAQEGLAAFFEKRKADWVK